MLNDSLIDKRIVERNISKGRVDASEYRRTLDGLPDLSTRVWRTEDAPAAAPAPMAAPPAPPAAPAGPHWPEESSPAHPSPFG